MHLITTMTNSRPRKARAVGFKSGDMPVEIRFGNRATAYFDIDEARDLVAQLQAAIKRASGK